MIIEFLLFFLMIASPLGLLIWLIVIILRDRRERKRNTKMVMPRIKGQRR